MYGIKVWADWDLCGEDSFLWLTKSVGGEDPCIATWDTWEEVEDWLTEIEAGPAYEIAPIPLELL